MSDRANRFTMDAVCLIRDGVAGEYGEKNARTASLNNRIEFHDAEDPRRSIAPLGKPFSKRSMGS